MVASAESRRVARTTRAPVALAALVGLLAAAPAADAARWLWSGSVALDHMKLYEVRRPDELAINGFVVEWATKTTVDVTDKITISGKVCTACHGITVDQAYAEIRQSPLLNLEAGRINVPFGDYYLRHDPVNDVLLSKPLPYAMGHMLRYQSDQFNLGVVPMPYSDAGASIYGNVWIHDVTQVWYALYAVNGFRSALARDFTFKNQVGDVGFSDNNRRPSVGGRLSVARDAVAVGGSYLRGSYDPAGDFGYEVWGMDFSLRVRSIQLRMEYLERNTEVSADSLDGQLLKKGFYLQAEVPAGPRWMVVGRLDGLLREGESLGTLNDKLSGIVRWTAGLNFSPSLDYSYRLEYERWRFTDFDDVPVLHAGVVVAY